MKVLAISAGSKNGSNDAMAREALMGAKEAGAEIEFIRLLDLDLKPCTGCIACVMQLMNGKDAKCVIKDDFNWLDDKVLDADAVIWVNPIFEKSTPGVMHLVQDRIAGPGHDIGMNMVSSKIAEAKGSEGPDPRKFKKKLVSFIAIGGSDWMTCASAAMNMTAMSAMWTVIDDEVFPWSKAIVMDDEAVKKCHQIGVNIANAAKDPESAKYMGVPGVCGNCNGRNFYLDKEGKAICEVCGIIGELVKKDDKYYFEFPQEQLEHAHNSIPGKFIHMDDIQRNESHLMELKKTDEFKSRQKAYQEFVSATKP